MHFIKIKLTIQASVFLVIIALIGAPSFAAPSERSALWPQQWKQFDGIYLRGKNLRYFKQQTQTTCWAAVLRTAYLKMNNELLSECQISEKVYNKNFCDKSGQWDSMRSYNEGTQSGPFNYAMRRLGMNGSFYAIDRKNSQDFRWVTNIIEQIALNRPVIILGDVLESKSQTHVMIIHGARVKGNTITFEVYEPSTGSFFKFNPLKRSDFFFGAEISGYFAI